MTSIADILPTNAHAGRERERSLAALARRAVDRDVPEFSRRIAAEMVRRGQTLVPAARSIGVGKSQLGNILNGAVPNSRSTLAKYAVYLNRVGMDEVESMFPGGDWMAHMRKLHPAWDRLTPGWRPVDGKVRYVSKKEVSGVASSMNRKRKVRTPPHGKMTQEAAEHIAVGRILNALLRTGVTLCARIDCHTVMPASADALPMHPACRADIETLSETQQRRLLGPSAGEPPRPDTLLRGVVVWLLYHVQGVTMPRLASAGVEKPDVLIGRADKYIPETFEMLAPTARLLNGRKIRGTRHMGRPRSDARIRNLLSRAGVLPSY